MECTMSRCTWTLVDEELTQKLVTITEPNAKQWLFMLMDSLSHDLFVKLSVTLWALWAARRKAIHEGIFQSPQTIYNIITRFIEELEVLKEHQPPPQVGTVTSAVTGKAKAPPQGHAKINVDAGVRQGSRGTAAAVCRDSTGAYLGRSVLVIGGLDDPASLEAIACREGIALAADL